MNSPLQKGNTIGLIAPSSPLMPGDLEPGVNFLERNGFKVKLGNHIMEFLKWLKSVVYG